MDDALFRRLSDEVLDDLYGRLSTAADAHDFELDRSGSNITVEFEDPPAKFVISPNAPVYQIWVSALSKSFKLQWDEAARAFVLPDTGQPLDKLIAFAIGEQLKANVSL